jgi:hypothetical protein
MVWKFGSDQSAKLMASNSPFLPPPDNKVLEATGSWELRGFVREGKAIYLTFFDGAAKRWITLSPGEAGAGLTVVSFDDAAEAATLRIDGRALTLALKADGPGLRGSRPVVFIPTGATTVASAPSAPLSLAISPQEAHRLELVANEIRQQLERAKLLAREANPPKKS